MKEISHLLRKAYLDLLNPFSVEGVLIPIADMNLNSNQVPANYRGGTAFVLITDQNEVETSNNQCSFRQTATLTFDVITKYPNGSGSRLASELISNEIQTQVNQLSSQAILIPVDGIQVLGTQKIFSQSFTEPGQSLIVYRKRITFQHNIYQS